MRRIHEERGFALVTVLMLTAMLTAMLGAYFVLTRVELSTTKSTMDATRGFYAAEAGLNLRAEAIRELFLGYMRPAGTSPPEAPGALPCQGADLGSGDFGCRTYRFRDRDVTTYVFEHAGNPASVTIPPGEPFQYLTGREYGYDVRSYAINDTGFPEAILEMRFKSRLVPLFQFAAFFNKDLELTPGLAMTIAGPVHSNFDVYTAANERLDLEGQLTMAGRLFRGRKEADLCWDGPVTQLDPVDPKELPKCSVTRREILQTELDRWNGMIRLGVDRVTVPEPDALDPTAGAIFWDRADLRLVYDIDTDTVELQKADGTRHLESTTLTTCLNPAKLTSNTMLNWREGSAGLDDYKRIRMLEIDVETMLDCLQKFPETIDAKGLDETSDGGLVWYLGVTGAAQDAVNDYGVRLSNGAELASTLAGAPPIRGLTVVTNQAAYIRGDYNRTRKKPAAVMADTVNILSNAWPDGDYGPTDKFNRFATQTWVNAALLAGTDTTGGNGGPEGVQDMGKYSGGVHNFLRLHEDWKAGPTTLHYLGSLVSLNQPRHVDGALIVAMPQYRPPLRDYSYDPDFNHVENLPPLTPNLVYLRQELFVRDFDL